ncbi:MAG: ribonuclease III [Solobacterium sp.]|nr:ribonuclease III [Solobacterium sp.]
MNIKEWLSKKGIEVNDLALIEQAFVHSSYANEHKQVHDNERLEFMGDAVLQLWSSIHIYAITPALSEGEMTKMRSQLVCEGALATYVRELGIAKFLYLGSGEEKTGGRDKDAILADMFEAFLGALFLDQGMEAVDILLNEVLLPHLKGNDDLILRKDYKTLLQEYVQADNRRSVKYVLVEESGPSNAPTFVMNVVVDDIVLGTGKGSSKKQAEQNAAKDAFDKMVR